MLVADYILKFFYEKKVKDIFLLTGGAASFIVDAFSRQNKVNLLFKPKNIAQINLLSENTSYENRKSIFQKQSIVRTLQEIKKRIKYDIFLNDTVISGGLFFTQNSSLDNIYQKLV